MQGTVQDSDSGSRIPFQGSDSGSGAVSKRRAPSRSWRALAVARDIGDEESRFKVLIAVKRSS